MDENIRANLFRQNELYELVSKIEKSLYPNTGEKYQLTSPTTN